MAKYDVTYSCGHSGEVQLYGSIKNRYRKIDWLTRNGLCPDCYKTKKHAEADATGPQVLVRYLAGFDPATDIERRAARAIRAQIPVDAMEEIPESARNLDWHRHYEIATCEQRRCEQDVRAAKSRQPQSPAWEILVINSYQVKDTLKSRGYQFERDAVSQDLLGMRTTPAWVKRIPSEDDATGELVWCHQQGWSIMGRNGPIEAIADALGCGRPDLLEGYTADDTVAAATEARETARQERAAARAACEARVAAKQEREAKAATFRVGSKPEAVRCLYADERTDDRPWDLRVEATDGRIGWGWASEDGWFVTAIERPDGTILELPAGSREGDRIGSEAHSLWRETHPTGWEAD